MSKLSLNRTIRQRLQFLKLAIVLNFVERIGVHRVNIASIHEQLEQKVLSLELLYVRGPTCKFFNQNYAAYALARSIESVMHCCAIDQLYIDLQRCH